VVTKYWHGCLDKSILINVEHSHSFEIWLLDDDNFTNYKNGEICYGHKESSCENYSNHIYAKKYHANMPVISQNSWYIVVRFDEDQESEPKVSLIRDQGSPVSDLVLENLPPKAHSTAVRDPRRVRAPGRDQC
jgi:hypothetical protein